jgi:hypothetical protein
MKTKTLVVVGALAALGFYLWKRQQDTIVTKPASTVGGLTSRISTSVRLAGERMG